MKKLILLFVLMIGFLVSSAQKHILIVSDTTKIGRDTLRMLPIRLISKDTIVVVRGIQAFLLETPATKDTYTISIKIVKVDSTMYRPKEQEE